MLASLIEEKIKDYMQSACIDDVDTDIVVGIDDWLEDFEEFTDYPRIVVTCDEALPDGAQIGGNVFKTYIVNIFLLCYTTDKADVVRQRDVIIERMEQELRSHQRLDNLADNNKERVFSSAIDRVHLAKFGYQGAFNAIAWIEYIVNVERAI